MQSIIASWRRVSPVHAANRQSAQTRQCAVPMAQRRRYQPSQTQMPITQQARAVMRRCLLQRRAGQQRRSERLQRLRAGTASTWTAADRLLSFLTWRVCIWYCSMWPQQDYICALHSHAGPARRRQSRKRAGGTPPRLRTVAVMTAAQSMNLPLRRRLPLQRMRRS